MTVLIGLAAGGAVGVVLGLVGAGGSLLTVPALILLLGLSATEATGTSLVVVAAMAVAGLAVHRRGGRCACKPGLQFAAAGLGTSAVAGWVAGRIPDEGLALAFAALLLVTGAWFASRARRSPVDEHDGSASGQAHTEHGYADLRNGRVLAAGAGIGALTGILGVGGGFLIVPALTATLGLATPIAIGTSQLVILANALAGLAGRTFGTATIVWSTGLSFAAGGAAGAAAGSMLAGRFTVRALQYTFSALAIVVAVVMAVRTLA